jgi:hypothetical protein
MIRKEAKSRFEINACNEKELSKVYCNAIFKQKFVVNTLKSYIYFSRFLTRQSQAKQLRRGTHN